MTVPHRAPAARTTRSGHPPMNSEPGGSPRLRRRVTASILVALVAAGGALAAAPPARAGWLFLDGRVLNVALACRDAIRFEAGLVVFEGQEPSRSDYHSVFKAAPPSGSDQPWDDARNVIRRPIIIPKLATARRVLRSPGASDTILLSHYGRYLMPVAPDKRPLALDVLALTMGESPSQVTTTVGDCFLDAPIDIVPGRAHNQVRIGRGQVTVALKSSSSLRADRLDARTFRFGPRGATPVRSRTADIDGDGRRDLVMTFTTAKTGLTCQSTSGTLVGRTRTGGRVEGRGRVAPVGCR